MHYAIAKKLWPQSYDFPDIFLPNSCFGHQEYDLHGFAVKAVEHILMKNFNLLLEQKA